MIDPTTPPLPEVEELSDHPLISEPVARGMAAATGNDGARPNRMRRWVTALAAVALIAVATVAGAVVLVGAGTGSTVARWAPADALAYVEVRADLPGDQRAALGEFLSAFPGFADQASLDRKLSELYDRLVTAASEGDQSYSADIAPWFGGQLGLAIGPLPAVTSLDDPSATADASRALAIASITDPAASTAWVKATAGQAGLAVSTSDAGGTELLLIGPVDHPIAVATIDRVMLVGDEASVREALARGGADGLSTVAAYGDAIAALPGQQAATVYLDGAAYLDWLERLPSKDGVRAMPEDLADLMPAWAAGGLRIESDALVSSGVMPHPSGAPDIADVPSELPDRLPASTIMLVDVHDLGQILVEAFARGSGVDDKAMRDQLEAALSAVGGIDGLAGWMGETGAVVIAVDGEALPGVVAIPSDPAAAADLGRSLRNLAAVAGLDPTDESYGDATITTVDLRPLGVAEELGSKDQKLSWVVTDEIVAVGTDPAFVRAALDAPAGDSLAEQARFADLLARVGRDHRSLVWADIDAIETLAVARREPGERARFETDIRPYLAPLGAFMGVVERDGSLDRSHGLLVLDEGR
jgi:hypothetical protein